MMKVDEVNEVLRVVFPLTKQKYPTNQHIDSHHSDQNKI